MSNRQVIPNRIAAVIVNYNMPERADALAEQLNKSRWPVDIILVDNGSDIMPPAKWTMLRLRENVQTTGGWLAGIEYANKTGEYLAYMFLITSAEILDGEHMVEHMATWLLTHPNAVGIHPALTHDSTTSWEHMKARGGKEPRPTFMMDNICSMYRADWFESIDRFDPKLVYGWGIDLETCYLARAQGKSLWIDERTQVRKVTDIGYTMNRMNMSADERRQKAGANMRAILSERYGGNWWERMTGEYVSSDLR